jgi:hypothetical protein
MDDGPKTPPPTNPADTAHNDEFKKARYTL